jgi:hypothetical protein
MTRFWKRHGESFDLEGALRENRPQPRPDFVRAVAERVHERQRRLRPSRLRVALTAGVTAFLLVALGSVGGLGYATDAAVAAFDTVSDTLETGSEPIPESSGGTQYFGARCGQEPPKKPADPEKRARCPMQAGKVKGAEGNSETTTLLLPILILDDLIPEAPVSVDYTTVSGTAKSRDYVSSSGTVTFNVGETVKFVPLSIRGDTSGEADEVFYVKLSNPSANGEIVGDTGEATILNDDEILDGIILED